MEYIIFLYRGVRYIYRKAYLTKDKLITICLFNLNRVSFPKFSTNGIPFIHVTKDSLFMIGNGFKMNNNKQSNPIGRESKCNFVVTNGGMLIIGNNVGISSSSIVCQNKVLIDDNVMIGRNTCIYDTDFHSVSVEDRIDPNDNSKNAKTKPVHIKKNSFIGAHTTILKGVTIGENCILGAGSLLTKNIPDNEIWAGNPASFISKNLFQK